MMVCDFCGAVVPDGSPCDTVVATPVEMVSTNGDITVDIGYSREWLACCECADLVVLGYWNMLIRRVVAAESMENDPAFEAMLRMVYQKAFGVSLLPENCLTSPL